MYYYNEKYYNDLDEIVDEATELFNSELEIPDNFVIEYEDCELRPIFQLNSRIMFNLLWEAFIDNSSEDGNEWDNVEDLIKDNMNFDAINSVAPKLWWSNGIKHIITKEEILKYINENAEMAIKILK
jgi:hypothetical protein